MSAFSVNEVYGDVASKAEEILADTALRTKYERAMKVTLPANGFHEKVGSKLIECLRSKGYNI